MLVSTYIEKKIPLSICIPTYNRAKSLSRTLKVLVPQCEEHNVQIVISNNCSKDWTDDLCKKITNEYNFIDYICQSSNIGFSKNLAETILLSKGRYIWTLGDDDIPEENAVEIILNYINLNPGWFIGNFKKVDESDNYQETVFKTPKHFNNINLNTCLNEMGIWSSFMSVSILSSTIKNSIGKIPKNDYFGFSLALLAGKNEGCRIIEEVIVSRKITSFKNHRFKNPEIYIFDFFSYLDKLVDKKEVSQKTRNKLANKIFYTITRICMNLKAENVYLPNFKKVYMAHCKVINFWLMLVPVYIFPSKVIKTIIGILHFIGYKLDIKSLKDF